MDRFNRTIALADDGDRCRLLLDAITDYAIFMLDPSGAVATWNTGAERLSGYRPSEIIGQPFTRLYTEDERQAGAPAAALEEAAREGRFEAEGWRLRKDGRLFWAQMVVDPVPDPAGGPAGYAVIIRDLTERKAVEEALRRSEQQFKLLVQGVTDYAIYMLDLQGRVSSWNAGAERIKGYRPDEIIGRPFSTFYAPEDRESGLPERGLDAAAREGRFENEGWRVRKDGTRFWAHVIIDAIRNDYGEVIGFAKITRDITERKEAQRALEQAQLALFQSQKLESIGQLTGGVAHDFNNLLMAVLGSLELARKRLPDDARALSLLDNAMLAAQRGAALTKRMLAFARRQDLKREAVDVAALVGGMRELLERSIGPAVDIRTRFPRALPPVLTDPNQLESALLNLAVNARDAMPGGGMITIAAEADQVDLDHETSLPRGRYVRLSVTDTGEGMDADTLARATEPFFTTKGVGRGTGLGLSMVHGLAEQSGGRLRLDSRPGEGVTATLWLPVAEAAQMAAKAEADAAPDAPQAPGAARALTILAVDDDNLVLINTAAMLEDLGHRVLEATSGAKALDLLEREPAIDLVISDQAMPGMTGLELAGAIKARRPHTPVVLATGYADLPPGVDRALPRLAKPFTQAELAQAIGALIGAP